MTLRIALSALAALALALVPSASRAELAKWDQAKVTTLAQQLADASAALYDTFYKQPVPGIGSAQSRSYQRLKQLVRRIKSEANELASSLKKGEGLEETQPSFEDLMQTVRAARENARSVFATNDVAEKAAAARALLNQLGPYYDPDFETLNPVTR